ncbi:acetyl-coenzyme A synthetase N-terminal domain-containing protein, partial [Emcibacter sp.]|uniref:acetyl-coenzyme A synthetase N-terminal domain-containing protein n=1 Tax=Emcibacter sp. TaxID=1979954 RepID=UPI003A8D7DAC
MTTYEELLSGWKNDPQDYWASAAASLDWESFPKQILHREGDSYRWFADGRLSACHNLIDRHVAEGRGGQAALI